MNAKIVDHLRWDVIFYHFRGALVISVNLSKRLSIWHGAARNYLFCYRMCTTYVKKLQSCYEKSHYNYYSMKYLPIKYNLKPIIFFVQIIRYSVGILRSIKKSFQNKRKGSNRYFYLSFRYLLHIPIMT